MVPQYVDDYYYDDPVEPPKQDRRWMVSLSLATILALIVIGETVGSLVTVNNKRAIEFGQGITFTLPCDKDGITVKPVAQFKKNATNQEFLLDSLFISSISDECLNRLFQVKFYNLSGPPLVIGYKNIVGATKYDADSVKFILSRKLSTNPFYAGLNWYTYPGATQLGSPPSPPDNNSGGTPLLCGGSSNSTDSIDFDWNIFNPLPGCPTNNWVIHFQGFLNVPGTDNGSLKTIELTLESYGNTELRIDSAKVLSDYVTQSVLTPVSTSISLRRGQSYLLDYWVYKPSGNSAAKLYWNLDSNGNTVAPKVIIPDSVLYSASTNIIEIAPTEGSTDYTIEETSSTTNNRGIKIIFNRPINAGQLQYLTLETSS